MEARIFDSYDILFVGYTVFRGTFGRLYAFGGVSHRGSTLLGLATTCSLLTMFKGIVSWMFMDGTALYMTAAPAFATIEFENWSNGMEFRNTATGPSHSYWTTIQLLKAKRYTQINCSHASLCEPCRPL